MIKKTCLALLLSAMLSVPVMAKNVQVEALSDFSTDNPPKIYSVKLVENIPYKDGYIERGSVVEGKVHIKEAARLKRDASFSFTPTRLTEPNGNVIEIKRHFTGKYTKELDKKKIAKTAVLSAGNFAVKGFSTGYTALEGAVKNEQGNRLKSSAVAVYQSTPLSYVEKGGALTIQKGDYFYINFKSLDEEE